MVPWAGDPSTSLGWLLHPSPSLMGQESTKSKIIRSDYIPSRTVGWVGPNRVGVNPLRAVFGGPKMLVGARECSSSTRRPVSISWVAILVTVTYAPRAG